MLHKTFEEAASAVDEMFNTAFQNAGGALLRRTTQNRIMMHPSFTVQLEDAGDGGDDSGEESGGDDDDEDKERAEDEDDEDGTLLTVQPGFNRLLLVLRDEGVMRFVKYVSAAAEGSRWDICGEFEIGMVQEDSSADES